MELVFPTANLLVFTMFTANSFSFFSRLRWPFHFSMNERPHPSTSKQVLFTMEENDRGYQGIRVQNLRLRWSTESNVLQDSLFRLLSGGSEEAQVLIRQMLGRPSNYPYESTFAELVYTRLVFEMGAISFSQDQESGGGWIVTQRDSKWYITPHSALANSERHGHLERSLHSLFSEHGTTRHLCDVNTRTHLPCVKLTKAAVLALHGFNRKGRPAGFTWETAFTKNGILPSFMTLKFRRHVVEGLASWIEENRGGFQPQK